MNFVHELIDEASKDIPYKIALIDKDREITYSELQEKSIQVSNYLLDKGVKKGERVLIKLPNSIEVIIILMAISRIGAIAVIIHKESTEKTINFIKKDCNPKLFFQLDSSVDSIDKGIMLVSLDQFKKEYVQFNNSDWTTVDLKTFDPLLIIYTSGSTGTPKGVISAHKNILFCTMSISNELNIKSSDVIGNFLSLSFDYGLYQIFLSIHNKTTLALGDSHLADIQLLKYIKKWRITVLPSLPHLTYGLLKLLERNKQNVGLRMLTNTGERLPLVHVRKLKELLPECDVYLMYGLTECKRVSILQPKDFDKKPDSVGRPLPGTNCYIVDEQNNPVMPGQIGYLVVKGPNVMQGYWNQKNSQLNKVFIKENKHSDNYYLNTGDYFKIDEDGFLYFLGRSDDLFKQNGYRLSTKEIENTALNIKGIELAVLLPPNTSYPRSTLFIKTEHKIDHVKSLLNDQLEKYKVPKEYIVLDNFPFTKNGKVNKLSLEQIRENKYEHNIVKHS